MKDLLLCLVINHHHTPLVSMRLVQLTIGSKARGEAKSAVNYSNSTEMADFEDFTMLVDSLLCLVT